MIQYEFFRLSTGNSFEREFFKIMLELECRPKDFLFERIAKTQTYVKFTLEKQAVKLIFTMLIGCSDNHKFYTDCTIKIPHNLQSKTLPNYIFAKNREDFKTKLREVLDNSEFFSGDSD